MNTDSWYIVAFLLAVQLVCSWYDLRQHWVPDVVVLPAIGVVALLQVLVYHVPWWQVMLAPIAGFGVFWGVSRLSGGRLGLGDAKMSALMILVLGALRWIFAVAIASAVGTLLVLLLIACGCLDRDQPVPFVPFLAVGSALSLLLTPAIIAFLGVGL